MTNQASNPDPSMTTFPSGEDYYYEEEEEYSLQ